MKLTRKLALALCLAFSFITLSSNAQVDSTTGNLINYGTSTTDTTSIWNNGVYVNQLCFGAGQPGNCGPNPSIREGNYINFSYGTTDLNQIVNINRALSAGGTGVQLSGFNFGFTAKNGNGWDDGRQDYLAAYVKLYNSGGGLAANYDYTSQTNQKYNWRQFNFSETFSSPILASQYSNAQVGFVGRDNNFWAGNYGPEIFNVSFSLKYRTDPCATNPAYSPNCAGFNNVLTSNNLVPGPGASASWNNTVNNSFAINTALANAGSAAQIHGFNWGYTANANGPYCAFWILVCFDNRDPSVTTNVNITNSAGASLYSVSREYKNSNNDTNYSYLFPTSRPMNTLGNFNFTATANDSAYVGSMWSRAIYTADPCAVNPLSSPTCSGYGAAFAKNLASTTSTTALAQTALPLSKPPMDNNGPLVSDGSFNAPGPVPGPAPGSSPPAGSEPPPSSPAANNPPGSPPPPGAAPNPSQGPGPTATATASTSAGPAARQEGAGKSSGGGNLSLAMSVVSRVQAADRATQASAVANAQQVVATSSAAAQEQANQVVEQANALSAESSQASQTITASSTSSSSQQTSSAGSGGLQGPVVMSIQSLTANAIQSSSTGTTQSAASTTSQANDSANTQIQNSQGLALQLPQPEQIVTTGTQQTSSNYTPSSTSSELPVVQSPNSQGLPLQLPQSEPVVTSITQQVSSTYIPPTASMSSDMPVAQSQSSQGLPLQAPQVTEQAQSSTQAQPTYQPPVVASAENNSMYSLTAGIAIRPSQGINLNSQANTTTIAIVTPQMMQQRQEFKFETRTEQEQPQVFQQPQTAMTRGSILNDIIEQRVNVASFQMEQQMDTVKKNVLPNELAGGVDIAAMAMVPKGYETYSIVTLRDVPFYKPEAIYKDNKTVDNARVLRGLTSGSDAKHQEMVNQQYK